MPVCLHRWQVPVRSDKTDGTLMAVKAKRMNRVKRCQPASYDDDTHLRADPARPVTAPRHPDQRLAVRGLFGKRPFRWRVSRCKDHAARRLGAAVIQIDPPAPVLPAKGDSVAFDLANRGQPRPCGKFVGDIGGEVTPSMEGADRGVCVRVVRDVLLGPGGEMVRVVGPKLHQVGTDIQPEIRIHAAECLACAKRPWSDDADIIRTGALCLEMQKQGGGAVTAANDAKAWCHRPAHRSAQAGGCRGETVKRGVNPVEHII